MVMQRLVEQKGPHADCFDIPGQSRDASLVSQYLVLQSSCRRIILKIDKFLAVLKSSLIFIQLLPKLDHLNLITHLLHSFYQSFTKYSPGNSSPGLKIGTIFKTVPGGQSLVAVLKDLRVLSSNVIREASAPVPVSVGTQKYNT